MGFGWHNYRDLLRAAHQQLGATLIAIWDNTRTHWMPGIQAFAAEHDWLTLVALPKYAPEINPTEGIWSLIKRGPLTNLVPVCMDELARHRPLRARTDSVRARTRRRLPRLDGLVIHRP